VSKPSSLHGIGILVRNPTFGRWTLDARKENKMTRKNVTGAVVASIFFLLLCRISLASQLFEAPRAFPIGVQPQSVAVGDLNKDGIPDLAVVNGGSGNVSVLLGDGAGTFQPALSYAAGVGPSSVVIADLDGDGRPDLVVANSGSNNVSVLFGNGDGTF
jgi:hypothetical protein